MSRALAPRDDEAEITDFVAMWFLPQTLKIFAEDRGPDRLVASLEAYVCRGRTETDRVIADAQAGDELSDFVLRKVFADMLDAGEMPGAALRTYARQPPRRRKAGRRRAWERWMRNIAIAVVVTSVSEFFGINRTREQASRGSLPASSCSIVKVALDRLGDHKSEGTVQNICASVAGEIGRMWGDEGALVDRVRAAIVQVRPDLARWMGRAWFVAE